MRKFLATLEVYHHTYKVSRTLLKKPQIVICPAYFWLKRIKVFRDNFFPLHILYVVYVTFENTPGPHLMLFLGLGKIRIK